MIAYFPEIYPDELVYSWFCRYYVHSGCLTHSMALNELLNKRCNNPSKEFIGHLNSNAQKEIEKIYSMDDLVLNHTMYPQYARFIPTQQKKEALYRLGHDFCDAHHVFSILPRGEKEQYLKYCPMCAANDRHIYGETYWHRKHQIRNMRICPKHKCVLKNSAVTAKSEQTFIFCPAEDYIEDTEVTMAENPLEIQFAEFMDKVFSATMDLENDTPISAILYHSMSKTKYLKQSGRTRYTKMLADDIEIFYSEIGINNIASIHQIQRALLGSRFDFSVICQIAFYLGIDVKELVSPKLTKEQIEQEQKSHYMKDVAPVDWQKYDEQIAPLLEQLAKDIYDGTANKIGRPERVSEKVVYRSCGLSKHRLDNMPKCRAIFEKYTESYGENYARRIVWAYFKLKEEKKDVPVYWSDIRLFSGVKKKNFHVAVPYLTKYADENITNNIIDMVSNFDM